MKAIIILLANAFFFIHASANDQPTPLEITHNRTSSIVFSSVIKSVDRGSKDILVQKAKGVDNVLQLKAARIHFPETNLTVITADGTIHQFAIRYAEVPVSLLTEIGSENEIIPGKAIFQTELTEEEMQQQVTRILELGKSRGLKQRTHHNISLRLQAIYVMDDVMFFHMQTKNKSNINYGIESLRFYIRDKSKMKRTASQENEVTPFHVYGQQEKIHAGTQNDLVYAVEKFTIPDAKIVHLEMLEHHGGRHINLLIKNKLISHARPLR